MTRLDRRSKLRLMVLSRRKFTHMLAAAAGGVATAPSILHAQNRKEKLNIAVIGSGGRGAGNLESVASENIVALCDVNMRNLEAAGAKYPQARKVQDFRKLFDKPNDFDAVVVSTCEHTHAFATMLALEN